MTYPKPLGHVAFSPRTTPMKDMSTEDIVHYFVELSLKEVEAEEWLDTKTQNKMIKVMIDLKSELRKRKNDQRHALLPLLAHSNIQVRLNAAIATMALAPEAMAMLKAIASWGIEPQSAEAKMMLWQLEQGWFTPT